jgi:hypothetical protein
MWIFELKHMPGLVSRGNWIGWRHRGLITFVVGSSLISRVQQPRCNNHSKTPTLNLRRVNFHVDISILVFFFSRLT